MRAAVLIVHSKFGANSRQFKDIEPFITVVTELITKQIAKASKDEGPSTSVPLCFSLHL
jgi:hypothetical protein